MLKYMKVIAFVIFALGFSFCESESGDCHRKIFIYNKSQSDIYFLAKTDSVLHISSQSPELYPNYKIRQNSDAYARYTSQAECWEDVVKEFNHIYIFLFNAAIIESRDWDSIVTHNIYLKRYDLTLDDLKEKNWNIYYE